MHIIWCKFRQSANRGDHDFLLPCHIESQQKHAQVIATLTEQTEVGRSHDCCPEYDNPRLCKGLHRYTRTDPKNNARPSWCPPGYLKGDLSCRCASQSDDVYVGAFLTGGSPNIRGESDQKPVLQLPIGADTSPERGKFVQKIAKYPVEKHNQMSKRPT